MSTVSNDNEVIEGASMKIGPANTVRDLRVSSLLEGTSFLILLISTIVKWSTDNETGVQIMGPVHGVLFLVYVALIFKSFKELGWSFPKALLGVVLGALPFGAFYFERRWLPRVPPT